MAHIQINCKPHGPKQVIINGVDYSKEVYCGFELVEVGDDPLYAEVGLRVTFAVGRLDLDAEHDVKITDKFRPIAQRVRSLGEVDA